jgi:tRNA A37 threonylcarbamoyladenosine dehydratase
MSDFEFRFGGIARLVGTHGLERLRRAHVAVIGIGGVGSWTVEALARSGIGQLTLVDLDDVCVSNINRQLHATNDAVGRPKIDVMADRVRLINPQCVVNAIPQFFTEGTAREILVSGFDYVVDAIDSVSNKCLLIAECRAKGIRVVACGGAGGRRDPSTVRVADLALTTHDRLLQKVREKLRKEHGFPAHDRKFGVPCVFSPESQVFPKCDGTVGDQRERGSDLRLNCESGLGTATFVTGVFGFTAASVVVNELSANSVPSGFSEVKSSGASP